MAKENLSAIIDRFEGEKAVLKFPDGQTLIVPIDYLPEDASESSALKVFFGGDIGQEEEKEQLAKKMLNELLKSDKS